MTENSDPSADLDRIVASARRLGVEIDSDEALHWLTAVATSRTANQDLVVDIQSGTFGHRVSMLDFSTQDLAFFRQVGRIVEFTNEPGVVETALALSGSAAQSKIQSYPGDCDYFERVNIKAESRAEACSILARIMRQKAVQTMRGDIYQLIEIKFGNYPFDLVRDGKKCKAGAFVSWKAEEARQGYFEAEQLDGALITVSWEGVAQQPGWCKLDWVIADPVRKQLANASNMLDVTWEAPDGSITPLDGYLDPYFQEIYLDSESIPIFSKLASHVSADALDSYVHQLEKEVNKYLTRDLNYGKAAKRMYNVFRLVGRYEEAAFLRELFDEPTTVLYQVWSLIRTIDDCSQPDSGITTQQLLAQCDQLVLAVVRALEGDEEAEIVRLLLRLRDHLSTQQRGQPLTEQAEAARAEVINVVNNFFREKLIAVPTIRAYMDERSQPA